MRKLSHAAADAAHVHQPSWRRRAPLQDRINSESDNHVGWLNSLLEGQDYFLGNELSAADVQLSFAVEVANVQSAMENFANLKGFLERIKERPAYKAALERGGPYAF